MKIIATLDGMFGKRIVRLFFAGVIVLVVVGFALRMGGSTVPPPVEDPVKTVSIATVGELMNRTTSFSTIGTVRAVSEARLQTEAGGRVTAVRAGIGDRVAAGAILASIENSRERAALLSAQGAYEAMLVSASQIDTGAASGYRNAYTVADDSVRNLADELFHNPLPEQGIIGFRVDTVGASGSAASLNAERRALEEVLRAWEGRLSLADAPGADVGALLADAERDLARVGEFITRIGAVFAATDLNATISAEEQAAYRSRFAAARTRIDQTLASLASARAQYQNPTSASQTEAILKQAQGSLQAAQVAYEKTLIRTPIAGVVNAFYLRANEYVSPGMPAAVVANNNALEIATAVGESDRDALAIGDRVRIDGAHDGTITRIAPALDPATGKIEVRIAAEAAADLANGSTVSVAFDRAPSAGDSRISIPLEAVKILPEGAAVFEVTDGALAARPVTLGEVIGGTVVVVEGLSAEAVIVTDARGLREGQAVSVESE